MKWATGHEIMAGTAQRHPGVDDLNEIHAGEQLVKKLLGNAAGHE